MWYVIGINVHIIMNGYELMWYESNVHTLLVTADANGTLGVWLTTANGISCWFFMSTAKLFAAA